MKKYYNLERPKSPWGDYSDILNAGMSTHLDREGGLIQLERTGPYIPPISLPGLGDIIVTDAFRQKLLASGLSGFHFQPVIKRHIVHLDWQTWNLSTDEPAEYPEGGEPEGYILDRPHSPAIAAAMGDLWEVIVADAANIHREKKPSRILLVAASVRGGDLFRAEGILRVYATEKAKTWLEQHAGGHVSFKEVGVV